MEQPLPRCLSCPTPHDSPRRIWAGPTPPVWWRSPNSPRLRKGTPRWRAWRALKMPGCLKTQDPQKMAMKTLAASGFRTRHVVGIYDDLHGFTMDAYHSLSMSIHVNSRFSPNWCLHLNLFYWMFGIHNEIIRKTKQKKHRYRSIHQLA